MVSEKSELVSYRQLARRTWSICGMEGELGQDPCGRADKTGYGL